MATILYGFFGDEGFTLIELMIIVSIIGILIAVGIPSYQPRKAMAACVEIHDADRCKVIRRGLGEVKFNETYIPEAFDEGVRTYKAVE